MQNPNILMDNEVCILFHVQCNTPLLWPPNQVKNVKVLPQMQGSAGDSHISAIIKTTVRAIFLSKISDFLLNMMPRSLHTVSKSTVWAVHFCHLGSKHLQSNRVTSRKLSDYAVESLSFLLTITSENSSLKWNCWKEVTWRRNHWGEEKAICANPWLIVTFWDCAWNILTAGLYIRVSLLSHANIPQGTKVEKTAQIWCLMIHAINGFNHSILLLTEPWTKQYMIIKDSARYIEDQIFSLHHHSEKLKYHYAVKAMMK